jgi:uncharacterized protein YheU (UPF0270 family)
MSSKQSAGIIRRFLFLSLLALLVGCGGGGGSGGDVPGFANRMITAFSFTAAANPQLGADLAGTINEADGTILLAGPLDVDDVAGLKASFTTTGKEVSVGGVVQESGVTENSFAGPLTYRVTAEDGSTRDYTVCVAYWKHPSGLTDNISSDGDAYNPQVAMDDNGNALIVWMQHNGTRQQIYKSEYRDGEWTHPTDLFNSISPDAGSANSPQVAMDDNGNALIVWPQSDGSNYQVFKSEYRDGAWIHPATLSGYINPNGEDVYDPQVAMDNSGNAVIVWQQSDGSTQQIYKSEYRDGAWTHPEDLDDNISQNGQDAYPSQVAMDDSGNAVIVWEQSDGINWQIFKSEYRDGVWTHPEDLDDHISQNGQDAYPSQVAMDDSGNAVIVWNQPDGINWQIFKSEYRFWEE